MADEISEMTPPQFENKQQPVFPREIAPKQRRNDNVQDITQPLTSTDVTESSNSAAGAELGRTQNFTFLPPEETGPPPLPAFSNNNNNNSTPEPSTSTLGQEPGTRRPLLRESSGRLAPPVTKGAPQRPPGSQSTGPPSNTGPPASQPTAGHLQDHNYYRQPHALTDHDYARQPSIEPPPGFTYPPRHGRPERQTRLPTRFNDYELN